VTSKAQGILLKLALMGQYTVLTQLPFPGNLQGQLIQASDGNLYGVVQYGFVFRSNLAGTNVVMVHDLTVDEVGSGGIAAGLIQASDGHLWGTSVGQTFGPDFGVNYTLTPAGSFLENFSFNCSNGGLPNKANALQGSDGNLYGTASDCGTAGGNQAFGTVTRYRQVSARPRQ
jgi:hypothetical protein